MLRTRRSWHLRSSKFRNDICVIQALRALADPLELCFDERQGSVGFVGLRGRFLVPWKKVSWFVRLWFTGLFY